MCGIATATFSNCCTQVYGPLLLLLFGVVAIAAAGSISYCFVVAARHYYLLIATKSACVSGSRIGRKNCPQSVTHSLGFSFFLLLSCCLFFFFVRVPLETPQSECQVPPIYVRIALVSGLPDKVNVITVMLLYKAMTLTPAAPEEVPPIFVFLYFVYCFF